MKKRMICLLLVLVWILTLAGCGSKTVTCEVELFGEDGVVSAD